MVGLLGWFMIVVVIVVFDLGWFVVSCGFVVVVFGYFFWLGFMLAVVCFVWFCLFISLC